MGDSEGTPPLAMTSESLFEADLELLYMVSCRYANLNCYINERMQKSASWWSLVLRKQSNCSTGGFLAVASSSPTKEAELGLISAALA